MLHLAPGDVLAAEDFYTRTIQYMDEVDPSWHIEWVQAAMTYEQAHLAAVLGRGQSRKALDCSCGAGTQAIPLAKLGWQVTGLDMAAVAVATARQLAKGAGVAVEWRVGDMRELGGLYRARTFDLVLSCMALDNLLSDAELRQALHAMHAVLKPGGRCYLRLRDFDHLLQVRPRYEFKEERLVPSGRVIRLDDWLFESDQHVVDAWVFLREDNRRHGYRWDTSVFAYRRRALRKVELEALLRDVGFESITFLRQQSPWDPYEVLAFTSGAAEATCA